MLQLTYQRLISTALWPTLQRLGQVPAFDGKTAYRLMKITEQVQKHRERALSAYALLGPKYAEKTPEGLPQTRQNGEFVVLPEQTEAYEKELAQILETSFKIGVEPISLNALERIGFSPAEMEGLLPLLTDLPETPAEAPALAAVPSHEASPGAEAG